MLYQCEPGVEKYFETDGYWRAVFNRQTWDHNKGYYTHDDVCMTTFYNFRDDGISCIDTGICGCYSYPTVTMDRVRWTQKDEETWLTKGYIPRRTASERRHIKWTADRNWRNQLITK